MLIPKNLIKADIIGIVNSSICLVHCLATPLLIAMGASFITNPFFEYLFIMVSFYTIYKATQNTNAKKIILLLWVSFCGFLFSTLFHNRYEWLEIASYFFAVLIIVGHILNIKHCKQCEKHNTLKNE